MLIHPLLFPATFFTHLHPFRCPKRKGTMQLYFKVFFLLLIFLAKKGLVLLPWISLQFWPLKKFFGILCQFCQPGRIKSRLASLKSRVIPGIYSEHNKWFLYGFLKKYPCEVTILVFFYFFLKKRGERVSQLCFHQLKDIVNIQRYTHKSLKIYFK